MPGDDVPAPVTERDLNGALEPSFGAHPLAFMMPRGVFEIGHYGRVLRYVLLRDALRNLSLEPSAGCRAVNHLGLTGSDPLQG